MRRVNVFILAMACVFFAVSTCMAGPMVIKIGDNNILKFFEELGVKNYEPNAEEIGEFKKLTKPVFDKYREQIGAELVDKVAKFVGYQ